MKCHNCSYTEFVEGNSEAECADIVEQLAQTHTNIFNHLEVNQYICDYGNEE